jgi:hypothetical protein
MSTRDSYDSNIAGGRFSRLPAAAVYDRQLTNRDVRVFAALAIHAARNGACFPSVGLIAHRLGVTRQAVQRQLRRLKQLGYIEVCPQTRPNGARTANLYTINYPPLDGATEPAGESEADGLDF